MITFNHFTYKYPKGTEPTLKDISLEIEKGEFILITGHSGAGKTTLCRAMFGALHNDMGGDFQGTLELKDKNVSQYTIGDIGAFMGVVFDDPDSQLFMPLSRMRSSSAYRQGTCLRGHGDIEKALARLGIAHLLKRATHELSGGEKQKLAIAAALAVDPEILLFDEPTSQLDPQSTLEIYSILTQLKNEGKKTIILVEQKIEDIIDKVDRIAVIDHGTVAAFGKPREVLQEQRTVQAHALPLRAEAGDGAAVT